MRFTLKLLTLVQWISVLHLLCFIHGESTHGKELRKNARKKVRHNSQKKFTLARSVHVQKKSKGQEPINGVRKDIFEMPVPIHIEHLKDYPVAVPVKQGITENVLHVHIHDSEFVCFVFVFTIMIICIHL